MCLTYIIFARIDILGEKQIMEFMDSDEDVPSDGDFQQWHHDLVSDNEEEV